MRYQALQQQDGLYALVEQTNGSGPATAEHASQGNGKHLAVGDLCAALSKVPRDDYVDFDNAFMERVFNLPSSTERFIFDSYWSRFGCSCPAKE